MTTTLGRLRNYEMRLRQWKEAREEGLRYAEPQPEDYGLRRGSDRTVAMFVRTKVLSEPSKSPGYERHPG